MAGPKWLSLSKELVKDVKRGVRHPLGAPHRPIPHGTLAAMRVRSLSFGLVLPVVLIALVLSLAVLQYQWLGKVSEAERAQMLRSLTQRAREFAEDFDAEMTLAYRAHQVSREALTANRFD